MVPDDPNGSVSGDRDVQNPPGDRTDEQRCQQPDPGPSRRWWFTSGSVLGSAAWFTGREPVVLDLIRWCGVAFLAAYAVFASGDVVLLFPDRHLDVPLFWQTWRVAPAAL